MRLPACLSPGSRRRIATLALAVAAVVGAPRAAASTPSLAAGQLLLDAAVAGDSVVAVGERGTVLQSGDAGRSWQRRSSGTHAPLTAVAFADARHGWAVGHEGVILQTVDGGASWRVQWQSPSPDDSFLDVLALDASRILAVGAYGLYVVSTDGGRTWTPRKILEDDYHLNRITRDEAGRLYLAGEHGTLLRSTDAGETWDPLAPPYEGSFYGILPLGGDVLLAYGLRGRVYRSDDAGASWTSVPADAAALLATAVRLPGGQVVLAGQTRAPLVSPDARAAFARREVGLTTGIAELLLLSEGQLLAVGEAGASLLPVAALLADAPPPAANP